MKATWDWMNEGGRAHAEKAWNKFETTHPDDCGVCHRPLSESQPLVKGRWLVEDMFSLHCFENTYSYAHEACVKGRCA